MVKSWPVQDQTVLGKDYSNLLISDSLLKTIWFINAPCYGNEALASPKTNSFGKDKSNPLIVDSLLKTTRKDVTVLLQRHVADKVVVDYVSKWAEAQALATNDARVVVTFLKKLFCHFGMRKALISDRGTHFCNKIMEKTMKRYGVNHRFYTSYHPQTSGQVENTNRSLKRILKKTVKDNPAIWSRKLDDALWAFRTACKTPTRITPYKLVYGNNCHLPFEIEHRA
ncbi:reverse transcriptase domain-containing protein [Tanacetum coccineum]